MLQLFVSNLLFQQKKILNFGKYFLRYVSLAWSLLLKSFKVNCAERDNKPVHCIDVTRNCQTLFEINSVNLCQNRVRR